MELSILTTAFITCLYNCDSNLQISKSKNLKFGGMCFFVLLRVPLDEKIDLHQYSKYEATCTASIMLARPALCKGNTFLSNSH